MKEIDVYIKIGLNRTDFQDYVIEERLNANKLNSLIVYESATIKIEHEMFKDNSKLLLITLEDKFILENAIELDITVEDY